LKSLNLHALPYVSPSCIQEIKLKARYCGTILGIIVTLSSSRLYFSCHELGPKACSGFTLILKQYSLDLTQGSTTQKYADLITSDLDIRKKHSLSFHYCRLILLLFLITLSLFLLHYLLFIFLSSSSFSYSNHFFPFPSFSPFSNCSFSQPHRSPLIHSLLSPSLPAN
jgi:hypothetical protein